LQSPGTLRAMNAPQAGRLLNLRRSAQMIERFRCDQMKDPWQVKQQGKEIPS